MIIGLVSVKQEVAIWSNESGCFVCSIENQAFNARK